MRVGYAWAYAIYCMSADPRWRAGHCLQLDRLSRPSKCVKMHILTVEFSKFSGGACPRTPLGSSGFARGQPCCGCIHIHFYNLPLQPLLGPPFSKSWIRPCTGGCFQFSGSGRLSDHLTCSFAVFAVQKTRPTSCQTNPCQNGGVCVDQRDTFVCVCPGGTFGKTCQGKRTYD